TPHTHAHPTHRTRSGKANAGANAESIAACLNSDIKWKRLILALCWLHPRTNGSLFRCYEGAGGLTAAGSGGSAAAQPLQLDAELAAALGATSTSKGDTVLDHVLFLYPHSDAIHIFNAATKRRTEN